MHLRLALDLPDASLGDRLLENGAFVRVHKVP